MENLNSNTHGLCDLVQKSLEGRPSVCREEGRGGGGQSVAGVGGEGPPCRWLRGDAGEAESGFPAAAGSCISKAMALERDVQGIRSSSMLCPEGYKGRRST